MNGIDLYVVIDADFLIALIGIVAVLTLRREPQLLARKPAVLSKFSYRI